MKAQSSIEKLINQVSCIPLDPALFGKAVTVYQRAASGVDATDHLKGRATDRPGIPLTNIPVNRGMLAVMRFAATEPDDVRRALALRIMYFMPAIEAAIADPRFAHVIDVIDNHNMSIDTSFHAAYAQCRFSLLDGVEMGPDLDDIHRLLLGGAVS